MRATIKNGRGILHTRMNPAIMPILPRVEGQRVWLKSGGLSFDPTDHNLRLFRSAFPDLEVANDDAADASAFEPPAISTYRSKTADLPHQTPAFSKAQTKDHFALFMDQGTGKTKVATDIAGWRYSLGQISGVLIVGPRGVHRQWVEVQMPVHLGVEFQGGVWPFKIVDGALPKSLLPGACLKALAINIDGISTRQGNIMCREFIKAHGGRVLMILDESQSIKNVDSNRWGAATTLGKMCNFRMILTGTPIAKNLLDEWAQLRFLDEKILGIKFKKTFRNEYCIMGGYAGTDIIGYRNLERFRAAVDPYTFRVTKEDIGILPALQSDWVFDMAPSQKALFKSMKEKLLALIDGGELIMATHAAVAALRLQQISNGFLINDNQETRRLFDSPEKNPRIMALLEIAESREGKIVVWCRYNEDVRQVMEALGESRAVQYTGETSDKDRAKALSRFTTDPETRFFVSNPAAGGTGIDGLQRVCNLAVYYSNSDNAIHRWQSEARTHRIGTVGVSEHIDLVAKGSRDRKIMLNIQNKKSVSEMAIGEIRAWIADDE